jgi:geranylgeranyl pyrophosphate synthase
MCEGEISQLKHRYRADLSLQEYLSFIEKKTAALIAVSAKSGAQLAGLSPAQTNQLSQFGLNIGISFQMVDDLLDVIGSEKKIGKTIHTDTSNGKMTLPMILLLKEMKESEKKQFLDSFQTMKPDWDQIQSWISQYNIIDKTERYASTYFDKAIQSLNAFDPVIQETLINLSRFILKRDY